MSGAKSARSRIAGNGGWTVGLTQFRAGLYRYLLHCLRNADNAEELAQEVYLRLLRVQNAERVKNPQAYMYRVAVNALQEFKAREEAGVVAFDSELVDRVGEQEFLAWLRRSPRHVEEFLFATTIWKKLHQFGQSDPSRVERLIAAAQESTNLFALPGGDKDRSRPLRPALPQWVKTLRIAAGIAGLAILGGSIWWAASLIAAQPLYATAVGEQRTVELEDGSVMHLNTHSRVAVSFSERAAPDVPKSIAWRERRLVFRADRLEDVAAEVNRYSKHPIRVEGDAARNLRVSAIFDASDPESLLRFLGKMETLSVDENGGTFVVRPR